MPARVPQYFMLHPKYYSPGPTPPTHPPAAPNRINTLSPYSQQVNFNYYKFTPEECAELSTMKIDNPRAVHMNFVDGVMEKEIGVSLVELVFGGRDWAAVEQLCLNGTRLGERGIGMVLEAIHREREEQGIEVEEELELVQSKTQVKSSRRNRVEILSLAQCQLSAPCTRTLWQHPWLHLTRLNLQSNQITSQGMQGFSTVPLPQLQHLNLSHNPLGNAGVKFLCQACLPRLHTLLLTNISITSQIAYLIASNLPTQQLCTISLKQNHFSIGAKMQMVKLGHKVEVEMGYCLQAAAKNWPRYQGFETMWRQLWKGLGREPGRRQA